MDKCPLDIWYEICLHIDDSKSYFNFAILSKQHYQTSKFCVNQKKEEFSKEIKKGNTIYKILPNGWKHGLYQEWYENGQLRQQINYKNDKIEGLCQLWYDNDQLWEQVNYVADKREGLYQSWYGDGSLREQINYRDDGVEGLSQSWYANGQLYERVNYVANKKEGLYQCWYDNGQLFEQANYKNNRKEC